MTRQLIRAATVAALGMIVLTGTSRAQDVPGAASARANRHTVAPLLVVDGIIIGDSRRMKESLRLEPRDILSVDILRGTAARDEYGVAAGGDGVIVIRTKIMQDATQQTDDQRRWLAVLQQLSASRPGDAGRVATPPQPLFIVDDVIVDTPTGPLLESMKDRIDRAEVIKGAAAIARFGLAGMDGVVIITTKKDR